MYCPHCKPKITKKIKKKTIFGYKQYRCCSCGKQYNERSGTKLNFVEYPTEVVMIAVNYYYRFKVSSDDVVELMAMRGLVLSKLSHFFSIAPQHSYFYTIAATNWLKP